MPSMVGKRAMPVLWLLSLCASPLLSTSRAHADEAVSQPPVASAKAEELFREAHGLLKRAQYREACGKFAASQNLEPASGTLLALAYCQERAGRLASAWHDYRDAQ